jgi:alpha-beta hydrolase superfamily lysophospholipase
MMKKYLLLLVNLCAFTLLQAGSESWESGREIYRELQRKAFSSPPNERFLRELTEFRSYYGINRFPVNHEVGNLSIGPYRIFVQILKPSISSEEGTKGVVFLNHGYLEHGANNIAMAARIVAQGWTVVLHDMPGHGLSSGDEAAIGSFDEFAQVMQALLDFMSEENGFRVMVGHSTGAAEILSLMMASPDRFNEQVDGAVLAAPLIRSAYWGLSRFGITLMNPMMDKIARTLRTQSSEPAFKEFLAEDPIQTWEIPFTWLDANYQFQKRIGELDDLSIKAQVKIIQGTKDDTVDWRYNLKQLSRLLPEAEVVKMEQVNHALFNEGPEFQPRINSEILNFLAQFEGS